MKIILAYRHVHKFCSVKFRSNSQNKRIRFTDGFFTAISGVFVRIAGRLGSAGAVDQRTYMRSLVWLGILRAWQLCLRRKHLETKYPRDQNRSCKACFDLVLESMYHHFHHILWATRVKSLRPAQIQVERNSTPFFNGRNVRSLQPFLKIAMSFGILQCA